MALRVRLVCRGELAGGFEAAGLDVACVADAAAAADLVRALQADVTAGIVLIDEALYRSLPHDVLARFSRQALPILAPIPVPAWDLRTTAEHYILDILRQAIGYRVRPR